MLAIESMSLQTQNSRMFQKVLCRTTLIGVALSGMIAVAACVSGHDNHCRQFTNLVTLTPPCLYRKPLLSSGPGRCRVRRTVGLPSG